MFEKLGLTRMAQALAAHSGARLETVARNVANADTPNFRALDVPDFAAVYSDNGPSIQKRTRPSHIVNENTQMIQTVVSDDSQALNGNSVSLDIQMMKAVAARQSHDMALAVYLNTSSIIRTSLGRNR